MIRSRNPHVPMAPKHIGLTNTEAEGARSRCLPRRLFGGGALNMVLALQLLDDCITSSFIVFVKLDCKSTRELGQVKVESEDPLNIQHRRPAEMRPAGITWYELVNTSIEHQLDVPGSSFPAKLI